MYLNYLNTGNRLSVGDSVSLLCAIKVGSKINVEGFSGPQLPIRQEGPGHVHPLLL